MTDDKNLAPSDPQLPEKPSDSALPEEKVDGMRLLRYQYSGQLPPPEVLRGFEDILPGAAERLFGMVEREQAHEHHLQKEYLALNQRNLAIDERNAAVANTLSSRGQILAFIIVIGAMSIGAFLLYTGHSTSGLAAIFFSLATVLALFLGYFRQLKKDAESSPSDDESPPDETPQLESPTAPDEPS